LRSHLLVGPSRLQTQPINDIWDIFLEVKKSLFLHIANNGYLPVVSEYEALGLF